MNLPKPTQKTDGSPLSAGFCATATRPRKEGVLSVPLRLITVADADSLGESVFSQHEVTTGARPLLLAKDVVDTSCRCPRAQAGRPRGAPRRIPQIDPTLGSITLDVTHQVAHLSGGHP